MVFLARPVAAVAARRLPNALQRAAQPQLKNQQRKMGGGS